MQGGASAAPNISQNYGSIYFIHLADIHLCDDNEIGEVFGGTVPPVTTTERAIEEVIGFEPEIVIQTGDIVALAEEYDLDTDERWYDLVNTTIYTPIKEANIPFLFAPGNHDPAGIEMDDVDTSDPRYGDGLLLRYLGEGRDTTYYSYNHGDYHFVVIDPVETEESGYRVVRLPGEQLDWLESDLENNSDKFIIIGYHQPLASWEDDSYNGFLNVISQYNGHIMLVVGHTHDNRVIYWNGIPEYQGGAVCGDWWQTGKTPDGNPMGYVIYYIENGTIYRFYKGIGNTEQINLLSPRDVVLNGTTPIELNVYYENKTIVNITYKIDNDSTTYPLNFTLINITKTWWYNAKGNIIITPDMLDDRKHNITIIVTAEDGSTFNRTFHHKFSNNIIMNVSEIIDDTNFNDYYGLFATINGTIPMVSSNGNLFIVKDKTGNMVIWAGDCKHEDFKIGDQVILRGQITQFKGTKELKLISGSDVDVYGVGDISSILIVLPNIETAYENFSALEYGYVEATGIVTAVFGNLVAIQDDTRGIELWLGEIDQGTINLGDVVTIRGQLIKYNNMVEIVAGLDEDLIINGSATVPDPKEISINDIPDNLGNLVTIKDLTVVSVDNRKIIVSDGINTTVLYCGKARFDPSSIVSVGDKIDVVGIAHLYGTLYEILPRSEEDIILSTGSNGEIITLKKGWNTISIPHRANISFSNQEAVASIITYYNNDWYYKSNLEPLYGYYIYCNSSTHMNIKYITPEEPTAPPTRPVFKGWNLVGVNPGKNDINGVRLKDFVLPVENSWIMILDLNGNLYTKNDYMSSALLYPYDVYWMYNKENDILPGRNLN
ncbi:metallophosphoesterase [Methanothermococcus sp. SCGC AD-155-C09]|nr:metallophosphoesterase [Methanothermococcus sp. SCGC AD-155-C09]